MVGKNNATLRTVTGVVVGLALALSLFLVAVSHATAPRPTRPTGACPKGMLPLPADGVIGAARAALASVRQAYPGEDVIGAELLAADRSAFARPRGAQVRQQCGRTIAARTVVVQMLLPKLLPSASLSESVIFVSDFRAGYRVWEVAH
jgi:hypothetical protein